MDYTAARAANAPLAFYFVIYPAKAGSEQPKLTIEFLQDGKVIGQSSPDLPAPDQFGHIAYVATAPSDSFQPGQYQIHAIVKQGQSKAEEQAAFTIIQ